MAISASNQVQEQEKWICHLIEQLSLFHAWQESIIFTQVNNFHVMDIFT